jgi:acyl carrier protein
MSSLPASPAAIQTELQEWLCAHLAVQLKVAEIDPTEPMTSYGVDSLRAVAVLADLEERVGFEIDPDVLWDHPTPALLASYLADRVAAASGD